MVALYSNLYFFANAFDKIYIVIDHKNKVGDRHPRPYFSCDGLTYIRRANRISCGKNLSA